MRRATGENRSGARGYNRVQLSRCVSVRGNEPRVGGVGAGAGEQDLRAIGPQHLEPPAAQGPVITTKRTEILVGCERIFVDGNRIGRRSWSNGEVSSTSYPVSRYTIGLRSSGPRMPGSPRISTSSPRFPKVCATARDFEEAQNPAPNREHGTVWMGHQVLGDVQDRSVVEPRVVEVRQEFDWTFRLGVKSVHLRTDWPRRSDPSGSSGLQSWTSPRSVAGTPGRTTFLKETVIWRRRAGIES